MAPLSFHYVQLRLDQLVGISANQDCERAGFDHPPHVSVQKRQLVRAYRHLDGPRLSRIQRESLETAQFFYRARHRTHLVANVELYHLIAAHFAAVRYVDRYFRFPLRSDGVRSYPQIRILETRITQPPAEGI